MHLNFIAFAIPLFVVVIVVEYIAASRQQRKVFRFEELVANLNVSIGERLADVFTTGLFYFFFQWLYVHYRLFTIPVNWISYVLLFIATDFVWYWYHRLGHQINIFWAAHGVHHQSADFNFTVAARITVFQSVVRCLFWAVLPILGFNPTTITVMLLVHAAYPIFTHTQLIGKLGWLEYLFVTPSHHRVHHSSNPEYLDKNYGDVLIIWDKLFGTFAVEEAIPVYGLTQPFRSYSFLWQHFHIFFETGIAFSKANGMFNKCKILFGKPGNINPQIRSLLERKLTCQKIQPMLSRRLCRYISIHTVVTIIVLFLVLLFVHHIDIKSLIVASLFILVSASSTGALLEQQPWVFKLEICKLVLCIAYIYIGFGDNLFFYPSLLILAVFLLFYKTIRSYYINRLYRFQ